MIEAFVYDAVRTPFGRFGGALAGVRPDDLAAAVACGTARTGRRPSTRPRIDEVRAGQRQRRRRGEPQRRPDGGLLAGYPVSVPGATVNRLCGSSLDAAMAASRADRDAATRTSSSTGGVESMTRAPWVLPKPDARVSRPATWPPSPRRSAGGW